MLNLFANSGDPDQMLHYAASDKGLHCLPVTLFGVSGVKWVECLDRNVQKKQYLIRCQLIQSYVRSINR